MVYIHYNYRENPVESGQQQPPPESEQQGQDQVKQERPVPEGSDQQENDPRGDAIEGGSSSAGDTGTPVQNPPGSEESVGEGTDTSSA